MRDAVGGQSSLGHVRSSWLRADEAASPLRRLPFLMLGSRTGRLGYTGGSSQATPGANRDLDSGQSIQSDPSSMENAVCMRVQDCQMPKAIRISANMFLKVTLRHKFGADMLSAVISAAGSTLFDTFLASVPVLKHT